MLHLRGWGGPLRRFAGDVTLPIADVQRDQFEPWIGGRDGLAPRTLDNYRAAIPALFRWARGRYLPRREPTAADDVQAFASTRQRGEIEMYRPWELPALLPALSVVLGTFAGLRTAELCRMERSAVRILETSETFPRCFIESKKSAAKQHQTTARRGIPISANLAERPRPYVFRTGPHLALHAASMPDPRDHETAHATQ